METSASTSTGMSTVLAQTALDDDAAFVSDINFVEMINKVCATDSALLFCDESFSCGGVCLRMALYCIKIWQMTELHSIYVLACFLQDVHSTWKAKIHEQFEGKTIGHMAALLGRNRSARVVK